MDTITTFEAGKTYKVRFIGDSDLVVPMEVVKRTKKFLTIKCEGYDQTRVGVKVYDDTEYVLPMGSYSMAPSSRADKPFA